MAGTTEEAVTQIKSMLNENFKMDDRGDLKLVLGYANPAITRQDYS